MSKTSPTDWMPLHLDAWRTKTRKLSPLERCAYLELLIEYWDTQEPLVIDHDDFANLIGISREQWDEISDRVLRFFKVGSDGLLHQERIDKEIVKAKRLLDHKREAGRKGGKSTQAKAKAGAQADAQAGALATAKQGAKHPRGLTVQLCETSKNAFIPIYDEEVENLISDMEKQWDKDPEIQKIRKEMRSRAVRGVA